MDQPVPYFRTAITDEEIAEVVECLRSGWLTSGPRVKEFEGRFAEAVGAKHAVALNSCTAALHLAVESLGLSAGQAVLVPSLTFAATAEIVRYQGAVPILVDCDPVTLHLDMADAERKVSALGQGQLPVPTDSQLVGIIPVHVGGAMIDMAELERFADRHDLWVVEDAAHAFPAAYRSDSGEAWRKCGENTAAVTCYSFYANKTITTGEGGMAVTDDADLAERMRRMSLHGLSRDAWDRFRATGSWDYKIVAPGYKYNLTDIAAAIGLHQLDRAEEMRRQRESIAMYYQQELSGIDAIDVPPLPADRIHSWHLYPIRLHLSELSIDRDAFIERMRDQGVGSSVHWRPLHLHPYYRDELGWRAEHLPVATAEWQRLISLPIFPGLQAEEQKHVVRVVTELCREHAACQTRQGKSTRSVERPLVADQGDHEASNLLGTP